MTQFKLYSNADIEAYISVRDGETKLGEKLTFLNSLDELKDLPKSNIIIGVPESIGPRANHGLSGAENAWKAFIKAFVNIQYNSFISNKKIVLLGAFDIDNKTENQNITIQNLREVTQNLDDIIYPLIKLIKETGHTPIVIGGGHNNCYPTIKGASLGKKEKISAINIDPHADFRANEGRHSGNGFSYAFQDGLLKEYHVFGLHENYNSEYILNQFKAIEQISFKSFESILQENNLINSLDKSLKNLSKNLGLEIDLDSIKYMPSSAYTPSGFSIEEVRRIINQIVKSKSIEYLHICEGAPNNLQENKIVGKCISYFVTDFIKSSD